MTVVRNDVRDVVVHPSPFAMMSTQLVGDGVLTRTSRMGGPAGRRCAEHI